MSRLTIIDLQKKVTKEQTKLVAIAAYTANMAKLSDQVADIILVGDSLGMVIYGMESTVPVSLELMINHGKAVVNSSKNAFIVIDMPFGSYQESKIQAFRNAALLLKETGAGAVKLEGGAELEETISYLTNRGIPVISHIGLLPQYINKLGGYKIQGKDKISSNKVIKDAYILEQAGADLLLIEGVKKTTTDKIMQKTKIPVIGIGASEKCDGQILVIDDLLGITEENIKFVKPYANLAKTIKKSLNQYANEVRNNQFPDQNHLY